MLSSKTVGTQKCSFPKAYVFNFSIELYNHQFNVNFGEIAMHIKIDVFNSSQLSIPYSILNINIDSQHNRSTCLDCASPTVQLWMHFENFIYFLI